MFLRFARTIHLSTPTVATNSNKTAIGQSSLPSLVN
jgi:hypothetical protein